MTQLLAEIRELVYTGSANLLVRYLKQGRADGERTPPSPRRLVAWLITKPEQLPPTSAVTSTTCSAECPRMTTLAQRVREFAGLLTTRRGHASTPGRPTVETDDLPALHTFVHGLRMDLPAVVAGLTLPYSNDPIEGANTKAKLLKRQMYVLHTPPGRRTARIRRCIAGEGCSPAA